MSTTAIGKKQCVKCNKGGGILICDGCQQPFCGKHVNEHRQELDNQLDGIMQEHDLLQQELGQSSDEHRLLKEIDKWEKESITKIQVAAEAARADLRQIIIESKEQLLKRCRDIAKELRASREADDFSENDLNRWIEQLKVLHKENKLSPTAKLCENEQSAIYLITIKRMSLRNNINTKYDDFSCVQTVPTPSSQDRFWKVLGDGVLEEQGLLAKANRNASNFIYVLGQQLYSECRHVIRFRIEQSKDSSGLYFGCVSSPTTDDRVQWDPSLGVGWFGDKELRQHGFVPADCHSKDGNLQTNDIVCLTFDCDHRQIELFHKRINKTYTAQVNISKAPFPWRFLIAFCYKNDCVRILPIDE